MSRDHKGAAAGIAGLRINANDETQMSSPPLYFVVVALPGLLVNQGPKRLIMEDPGSIAAVNVCYDDTII